MKRLAIIAISLLALTSCGTTAKVSGSITPCNSINHSAAGSGKLLECVGGGEGIHLGDLRGPMIVNVWGSWCTSCKDELPILLAFYPKLSGTPIQLVGIDVEETSKSDGLNFMKKEGMLWPSLLDPDGRTRGAFGMGVPVTWFIAADGTILYKKIGVLKNETELRDLVKKYFQREIL